MDHPSLPSRRGPGRPRKRGRPRKSASNAHVLAFVTAYNFAKHLKALRWRTPFQAPGGLDQRPGTIQNQPAPSHLETKQLGPSTGKLTVSSDPCCRFGRAAGFLAGDKLALSRHG